MRNTQGEAFKKPLPAVLSCLLQVCQVIALTVVAEKNSSVGENLTTKEKSNIDFMPRRMTARVWAHVCARQGTNSKPRTSLLLFFPPDYLSVCLCVIITQQLRRTWVIHRAACCIIPMITFSSTQERFHFICQVCSQLAATLAARWACRQSVCRKTAVARGATFSVELQNRCYDW